MIYHIYCLSSMSFVECFPQARVFALLILRASCMTSPALLVHSVLTIPNEGSLWLLRLLLLGRRSSMRRHAATA